MFSELRTVYGMDTYTIQIVAKIKHRIIRITNLDDYMLQLASTLLLTVA